MVSTPDALNSPNPNSNQLRSARAPSGVKGFDDLIEGGFPRGDLILLVGHPGSGKTIFSSQFLYEGATNGEPGLYVSFAENRQAFLRNMRRTHMDFEKLESQGLFKFVDLVTVKETGIEESLTTILKEIDTLNAKRLVIDSFSAMAQAFPSKIEARVVLHTVLGKMTRFSGVTTLLISEKPLGTHALGVGMEEFVSDGVVVLTQTSVRGYLIRHLDIFKMRGTNASRTRHTYEITEKGMTVHPFFDVPNSSKTFDEKVSTGIDGLDRMLAGGPYRGSIIMFLGESGSGKTTSALQYLVRGAQNKQKVLYLSFEENEKELVRNGEAFGWHIKPYIDNNLVRILTFAPEAYKLEAILENLRESYQEFPPSMVIIDSLSSLAKAIPDEEEFYEFVRRLFNRCKDRGITMLTTARTPQGGLPASFETSALADIIIHLRQVESNSALRRALIVFKARGLQNDPGIHEFEIGPKGITVHGKFTDLEQILSGTPKTSSSAQGWADAFTSPSRQTKTGGRN